MLPLRPVPGNSGDSQQHLQRSFEDTCVFRMQCLYLFVIVCAQFPSPTSKMCVWFPTCKLHLTVLLKGGLDMHGLQKYTKSVLFVLRWPFLGRVLAKGRKDARLDSAFDLVTGHIW